MMLLDELESRFKSRLADLVRLKDECSGKDRGTLEQILDTLETVPITQRGVSIGFTGERGTGKSSLINSFLLADTDQQHKAYLPEDQMRSSTAAIVELSHWEKKSYCALIYFIPKDEWNCNLKKISQFATEEEDGDVDVEVKKFLPEDQDHELERLEIAALFGLEQQELSPPASWADDYSVEKSPFKIPPLHYEIFSLEDMGEFFEKLDPYIRSQRPKVPSLWPLVSKIDVFGPFPKLKGVTLMDIPGTKDGSPAMAKRNQTGIRSCYHIYQLLRFETTAEPQILRQWALSPEKTPSCDLVLSMAHFSMLKTNPNMTPADFEQEVLNRMKESRFNLPRFHLLDVVSKAHDWSSRLSQFHSFVLNTAHENLQAVSREIGIQIKRTRYAFLRPRHDTSWATIVDLPPGRTALNIRNRFGLCLTIELSDFEAKSRTPP